MNLNRRLAALEAKAAARGGCALFIEGEDGTVDEIRQKTADAIRSGCAMVLLFTGNEPREPWPQSSSTVVLHFDTRYSAV